MALPLFCANPLHLHLQIRNSWLWGLGPKAMLAAAGNPSALTEAFSDLALEFWA